MNVSHQICKMISKDLHKGLNEVYTERIFLSLGTLYIGICVDKGPDSHMTTNVLWLSYRLC